MRPPYPPLADRLEQFASYRAKTTGSELFYNYLGCTLTEGAQLAADLFRCWWLLDIIASVQPQLRNSQPFQCWAVTRDGDGCQVIADDGNGVLARSTELDQVVGKRSTLTGAVAFEPGKLQLPGLGANRLGLRILTHGPVVLVDQP